MNTTLTRRGFFRAGAIAAATAISRTLPAFAQPSQETGVPTDRSTSVGQKNGKPSPVKLGLASYTFRNFTRAQLIAYMKQLNVIALNAKDAKDHLPMDPTSEAAALADYAANNIKLHAVGAVPFTKDEDADIQNKFEYAKRAGVPVIVASDPDPATLLRIEKFVKQYDIRIAIHNHGPENKLYPSPLDALKAVKNLDPRMGCCIDVGHCVRAGTDVVEAIHACGSRLFNMHMKDLTSFTDKESQVAVGDGLMPVREIFAALIKIKYPGYVDLEYEIHPDNPMPGVIASFAYMRGVLTGMGYKN